MGASEGYASAIAIDAGSTPTLCYEFMSESMQKRTSIIDGSGLRGSRSHRSERTRFGNSTVGGTLTFEPSPEELALLLPWIMGAAGSGTTYALAETLPTRNITIDKVAKVMKYTNCVVNRATFSGSEGQPMMLTVDVVGVDETIGNAGSFAATTYTNTAPFMFTDSVATLVAGARNVKTWSVVIDNALDVLWYNSVNATDITPRDRIISFSCQNPYTSAETDLYNQTLLGTSNSTLVLAFANYSLTFTFATLQFPSMSPVVSGRTEIPLILSGIARSVSTTKELVITLDSTP